MFLCDSFVVLCLSGLAPGRPLLKQPLRTCPVAHFPFGKITSIETVTESLPMKPVFLAAASTLKVFGPPGKLSV
jgi:hypothetical protein